MRNHTRRFSLPPLLMFLSVFIGVHPWLLPERASAQEMGDAEVAVNLAEGRVVICAAKDGIILAAVDAHEEAGSRPPAIAMLSAVRMGVVLGAVEWVQPDSRDKPVRLDDEFRGLIATALNTSGAQDRAGEASDIEVVGVALLERVRQLAALLHHKINLGEDEPLIRVVLAGYVPGYGPEAWTIDYRIRQDDLGSDAWRTRVLRPAYNQIYPPEKGRPRTLIEVRYPPENRATGAPELLDLLQQNDARLGKIRAANEIQEKSVALVVQGLSQKAEAASVSTFLKAALPAIAPPETDFTMAMVDYDRGFQWIVQPPKAPASPSGETPGKTPGDKTPETPEKPTLLHKPRN